jgi:hypothetical protein
MVPGLVVYAPRRERDLRPPVSELMHEAADALPEPYRIPDITAWFAEHYPKIKTSTVSAHVIGMTANHRSRHHYPWLAAKEPVSFRTGYGQFVRFDPDVHTGSEDVTLTDDEDALTSPATEEQAEFVVESQLEEFLLDNWERIDWGRPLTIWEGPEGTLGHQYATEVGRIDLLCTDASTDALVVVELKRGRPSDRVVGQTARYIGWVQTHLARPRQAVEGLIVSHETDDQLAYAASAVPGLRLMTYEVTFELRPADPPGQRVPAGAAKPAV